MIFHGEEAVMTLSGPLHRGRNFITGFPFHCVNSSRYFIEFEYKQILNGQEPSLSNDLTRAKSTLQLQLLQFNNLTEEKGTRNWYQEFYHKNRRNCYENTCRKNVFGKVMTYEALLGWVVDAKRNEKHKKSKTFAPCSSDVQIKMNPQTEEQKGVVWFALYLDKRCDWSDVPGYLTEKENILLDWVTARKCGGHFGQ